MANDFNARLYARCRPTAPASARVRDRLRCTPEDDACGDCGSLRCLCRPRFFAGQLLSEQDLNRLDEYIREKNRLHTLHLHGWGVVNGLEVSCDACGDGIVVGCGYAISPCGDDIVVCDRTGVDICALIDKCCHRDRSCQPYRGSEPAGCSDAVEDWVLAIRYAEHGSRGVAALRSPSCSCGASSGGCGCGKPRGECSCGTKGVFQSACKCQQTGVAQPRAVPAACEPTMICEGYAFEVFRAPVRRPPQQTPDGSVVVGSTNTEHGELVERFACCIRALAQAVIPVPTVPYAGNHALWNTWCCNMKAALARVLTTQPSQNCELVAQLSATPCPDPALADAAFGAAMDSARALFRDLLLDMMLSCLCAALMPPCPEPANDDRVPLAVVSVQRKGCKVLRICNWTPLRRIVVTAPAVRYWTSFVPWFRSLRELIHAICCDGPRGRGPITDATTPGITTKLNATLDPMSAAKNATFGGLLGAALQRTQPLQAHAVAAAAFGMEAAPVEGALSEQERANLPEFLLLNQLLGPLVRSLSGSATSSGGTQADDFDMRARVDRLEAELASLRAGRDR